MARRGTERNRFPPAERSRRTELIRRRRRAAGLIMVVALAAASFLILHAALGTDTHGASVSRFSFASRAVGHSMQVSVVTPSGDHRRRPLLVFLHGRNDTDSSFTDDEALFTALAMLGARAPIVAFPDGGTDSYWHNRRSGEWGDYVTDEVIPEVARRFDADPTRVAIGGISMGGFGAYDVALTHQGRFCAVGGHSPALWLRGRDTAPGAFDDAADFARNDVIAQVRGDPNAFGSAKVWNDAGDQDPFLVSDVAFVAALRRGGSELTAERWRGGHDRAYWDRHWTQYLRFYANALTSCHR